MVVDFGPVHSCLSTSKGPVGFLQLKRREAGGGVGGLAVGKQDKRQGLVPLPLVILYKLLQTGLESAIESFYHPVGLRVVRRRLYATDSEHLVELVHQITGEIRASVGQDFVWDSGTGKHLD